MEIMSIMMRKMMVVLSFDKSPICISVSSSVMDPKNQRYCVRCHLMMNIKKTKQRKKDFMEFFSLGHLSSPSMGIMSQFHRIVLAVSVTIPPKL